MKIKTINYCQNKILQELHKKTHLTLIELVSKVLGPSHYNVESETNFDIAAEILVVGRIVKIFKAKNNKTTYSQAA